MATSLVPKIGAVGTLAQLSTDVNGNTVLVGGDGDFYAVATVAPSGDVTGATDAVAINAALAANSHVKLVAGDYYINDTLILVGMFNDPAYLRQGKTLDGDGIGQTRITMTTAGIPAIQKNAGISCNISGFSLYGPGVADVNSVGYMSETVGGGYFVRDVYFDEFATAIRLYDATLTKFDNVQIRACGWGIELGFNTDAALFQSCRIQENINGGVFVGWRDATHPAIPTTNNDNIVFDNCIFARQPTSFDISDSNSTCIKVSNCYFEDEQKIAWIGLVGELTSAKKIIFDNCHFEYSAHTPAQALIEYRNPVSAASDIAIINCHCQDALPAGIAYLVAGIKTAIKWERNHFPFTDVQIDYYSAAGQHYPIINVGNVAVPTTALYSATQLILLGDAAILGKPALACQLTNGSNSVYAEFKRIAANTGQVAGEVASVADVDGKWGVFKGVHQLISPAAALPTAAVTYRGCMAYQSGAGGAADTIKCCMKSAADTYSWVTVATG